MKKVTIDGNFAASNIAYLMNDSAFIYPITPSSPMAENCDIFAYNQTKNVFGNVVQIKQMQSEAGVAGAVHGSLISGSKTTTFTSSQGLLLMIPNMYKIAGEGLPCVFYVAARSLATHALNIFCDYSDVYACLKTGFNIVSCSNVQEVNDIAIACELASLKSKIPYICFFDGFRTSHELSTIYQTELKDLKKIMPFKTVEEFRKQAMNSAEPFCAGTNQNPDVFMQNRVASLKKYQNSLDDFKWALKEQEKITNRCYDTVEYFGSNKAENVVVCMGSACDTLCLALSQYKGKVGVLKIRTLKPFDEENFINKLPKTVKNITILERNLDVNGTDTLSSFVCSALMKNSKQVNIYSGCFGLGGKEFTPDMAISVFENMKTEQKKFFTVGITDDVTNTSLDVKSRFNDNISNFTMRVYGLGSDGSVSSVKNTIKILGEETDNFMQGYFDYDSKKSGSLTISHLRSSFLPIKAPFNPRNVDFVMCNNQRFIEKYNITECLKKDGVLLINTEYSEKTLNEILTNEIKTDIIRKNIKVYTINAYEIAKNCGLGNKINTIMQTAMFKISNLIPFENAIKNIKKTIINTYSKKGDEVVNSNIKAVDCVEIKEIVISKGKSEKSTTNLDNANEYYANVIYPTTKQKGDEIPVSKFDESGKMPTDTSKFEKRGIANKLPNWISEKCIQCGRCSVMCPHAAIRPILVDSKTELPKDFETRKEFLGENLYRMQLSPLDCTGCGVCASACPVKAIIMEQTEKILNKEIENDKVFLDLPKIQPKEVNSIKDVQFKKSYFEFSGACAGCGETPYIKLLTQLFGDRMLVANATGCSSIYGGTFPTCPYSKDEKGFGVSWANSLFEDNAEFGYGISVSKKNLRKNFIESIKNMNFSKKFANLVKKFLKNTENHSFNKEILLELKQLQKTEKLNKDDKYLCENSSLIISPSVWIVGGDGWAYDIGFGGLDHVVASGENVNVLILDTEVYSNTGGQTSKSTPRGATAKFNMGGKLTKKKDLASMLMCYEDVFVAEVCLNANPEQCLQAFIEAEKFNGPSVIIAYAPCVNHGYDMGDVYNH